VTIRGNEKENKPFPPFFSYKDLDAINLGNIQHHESVKVMVPPLFKDQSAPIISYSYSSPIAPTLFNYKRVLQDCSIDDPKAKSPNCSCPSIENTTSNFLSSLWMTIPEN
jgi:hypothetical protein